MTEVRTPLIAKALWPLLALLLLVMLVTASLRLVREFHERPVQVYVCTGKPVADCEATS